MPETRHPQGQSKQRSRPKSRPAPSNPSKFKRNPKPTDPKLKTPKVATPSAELPTQVAPPVEFPSLPPKLDYIIIAEIASPFGLRGAVKANILTDFPERFDRLEEVFLAPPGAPLDAPRTRYEVMSARIQNEKQVMLRLVGLSKIEQADKMRGYTIAVPIAEAVELPEGEYYIFQIIGLDVYTSDEVFVGKVVNVESRPANDVYIVRGPMSRKDLMLPAIKDVVKNIDLEAKRITVELIDGLLDL